MQIALISDIHANLPALEAVMTDIDRRAPDAIYCLGDLIGYNVWPNEVIGTIRERKIATIAGNHDLKVFGLKAAARHELELLGKSYAYHIIDEAEREYLLGLPAHIRIEFKINDKPLTLLLVHGSPRSVDEYLFETMLESELLLMMQEAKADILCFGHTHKPYHRVIDAGKKHAINLGSVGKPKDNDNRACYVILDINTSITENADSLAVNFVRVPYDVEKAAMAVENSPLPNEFAEMLRKAY